MAFYGKPGDRVRLVFTPNGPDAIPESAEGTVTAVKSVDWKNDKLSQVAIDWDNGRRLICAVPPNFLQIITAAN